MPLCNQLAPLVWHIFEQYPILKNQFNSDSDNSLPAKDLIGENFENLKLAFSLIDNYPDALKSFKYTFNINEKIKFAPESHSNIAKLVHEKFFELIISFNWDSLIEFSWENLYGTNINAAKLSLIKPHGDILDSYSKWILPNSPGYIDTESRQYINNLVMERPRTLIIVGYSENDSQIVQELITPLENKWNVYRVTPYSNDSNTIQMTANDFFEELNIALIDNNKFLQWNFLNYKNQSKDLATPLLGYKLTPREVEVCPELNHVSRGIKILNLNHFIAIQGKPGSGKSISSYKIAYHFLKEGYEILRYNPDYLNDSIRTITLPNVSKVVLIIDDAHLLRKSTIIDLQEKSNKNIKIIVTLTDEIQLKRDWFPYLILKI
ncbi:hypothetical protein [Lysinibacillus fusiformis]|uniref:nSTAND3 domain-containing NTPase n=1 Tax=Lysinibacillus fusiformis TaxID=28031 RepID=UPI002E24267B|nr:hypothetical protein [Lysinibacillus fusiformis]